ncbi:Crp/Fnr family transcriptional regulator [Hymenobacter terrenus]|uniref:Crp/Fnr family transcriptional regulator n=1 Tax=Hymenobacter terrenus TaxID=1629124 RepID=UPI000619BD3B|nr:Crp/Fnr family transcriptional regulator [Hymenobacter terrenus]
MEAAIRNQLSRIIPLSDKEWNAFKAITLYEKVPNKELIKRSAYIGRRSFFVIKGAFRLFYIDDSANEITTHFFLEPNFITNCESFLSRIQENLHIEAIEESELLVFGNDALTDLYELYPNLKQIETFVIKSILNETVHHNFLLQLKTPEEQYKTLLSQNPALINRVSVTHLSSYLGMARETLSRVRSKQLL